MDCSDEEIAYLVEGEALVIRCALNMQIKEDDVDQRRGNTRFQTNSASSSSTWRPNLKREGLSNQSLMQKPNHLRPKRMLMRMGKVNLNLNLLVIEILNVLSV